MSYSKAAEVSGTATAAADGTAAVVLNAPPGVTTIESVALIVTGSTALPVATMYDGSVVSAGRIMATIRAGDRGTFRGTGDQIRGGQQVTIGWTGATVGAICRAVLRGKTLVNA